MNKKELPEQRKWIDKQLAIIEDFKQNTVKGKLPFKVGVKLYYIPDGKDEVHEQECIIRKIISSDRNVVNCIVEYSNDGSLPEFSLIRSHDGSLWFFEWKYSYNTKPIFLTLNEARIHFNKKMEAEIQEAEENLKALRNKYLKFATIIY